MLKEIHCYFAEDGCNIDIDALDDALLKMPAEKYIELFTKMELHIRHLCLNKFEVDCNENKV